MWKRIKFARQKAFMRGAKLSRLPSLSLNDLGSEIYKDTIVNDTSPFQRRRITKIFEADDESQFQRYLTSQELYDRDVGVPIWNAEVNKEFKKRFLNKEPETRNGNEEIERAIFNYKNEQIDAGERAQENEPIYEKNKRNLSYLHKDRKGTSV